MAEAEAEGPRETQEALEAHEMRAAREAREARARQQSAHVEDMMRREGARRARLEAQREAKEARELEGFTGQPDLSLTAAGRSAAGAGGRMDEHEERQRAQWAARRKATERERDAEATFRPRLSEATRSMHASMEAVRDEQQQRHPRDNGRGAPGGHGLGALGSGARAQRRREADESGTVAPRRPTVSEGTRAIMEAKGASWDSSVEGFLRRQDEFQASHAERMEKERRRREAAEEAAASRPSTAPPVVALPEEVVRARAEKLYGEGAAWRKRREDLMASKGFEAPFRPSVSEESERLLGARPRDGDWASRLYAEGEARESRMREREMHLIAKEAGVHELATVPPGQGAGRRRDELARKYEERAGGLSARERLLLGEHAPVSTIRPRADASAEWTFRPSIDARSEAIVRERGYGEEPRILQMQRRHAELQEELRLARIEAEAREQAECTFAPNLSKELPPAARGGGGRLQTPDYESEEGEDCERGEGGRGRRERGGAAPPQERVPLYERTAWERRVRDEELAKRRMDKLREELEACTFKPNIRRRSRRVPAMEVEAPLERTVTPNSRKVRDGAALSYGALEKRNVGRKLGGAAKLGQEVEDEKLEREMRRARDRMADIRRSARMARGYKKVGPIQVSPPRFEDGEQGYANGGRANVAAAAGHVASLSPSLSPEVVRSEYDALVSEVEAMEAELVILHSASKSTQDRGMEEGHRFPHLVGSPSTVIGDRERVRSHTTVSYTSSPLSSTHSIGVQTPTSVMVQTEAVEETTDVANSPIGRTVLARDFGEASPDSSAKTLPTPPSPPSPMPLHDVQLGTETPVHRGQGSPLGRAGPLNSPPSPPQRVQVGRENVISTPTNSLRLEHPRENATKSAGSPPDAVRRPRNEVAGKSPSAAEGGVPARRMPRPDLTPAAMPIMQPKARRQTASSVPGTPLTEREERLLRGEPLPVPATQPKSSRPSPQKYTAPLTEREEKLLRGGYVLVLATHPTPAVEPKPRAHSSAVERTMSLTDREERLLRGGHPSKQLSQPKVHVQTQPPTPTTTPSQKSLPLSEREERLLSGVNQPLTMTQPKSRAHATPVQKAMPLTEREQRLLNGGRQMKPVQMPTPTSPPESRKRTSTAQSLSVHKVLPLTGREERLLNGGKQTEPASPSKPLVALSSTKARTLPRASTRPLTERVDRMPNGGKQPLSASPPRQQMQLARREPSSPKSRPAEREPASPKIRLADREPASPKSRPADREPASPKIRRADREPASPKSRPVDRAHQSPESGLATKTKNSPSMQPRPSSQSSPTVRQISTPDVRNQNRTEKSSVKADPGKLNDFHLSTVHSKIEQARMRLHQAREEELARVVFVRSRGEKR